MILIGKYITSIHRKKMGDFHSTLIMTEYNQVRQFFEESIHSSKSGFKDFLS